ncbi:MAG: hypothetical protein OGMRLDGQ_000476 [Candidatus Fervidibacter sp.]
MLLLALLLFQSPQEVYYAWGWHGGYYLTDEVATREAFDRLFDLLDALPHLKAVFEIEPYTLERMLHGEKFEVERIGRNQPQLVGWQKGGVGRWEFAIGAKYARKGNGIRLVFHRSRTRKGLRGCENLSRMVGLKLSVAPSLSPSCSSSATSLSSDNLFSAAKR